jgi:hypothetical protein
MPPPSIRDMVKQIARGIVRILASRAGGLGVGPVFDTRFGFEMILRPNAFALRIDSLRRCDCRSPPYCGKS